MPELLCCRRLQRLWLFDRKIAVNHNALPPGTVDVEGGDEMAEASEKLLRRLPALAEWCWIARTWRRAHLRAAAVRADPPIEEIAFLRDVYWRCGGASRAYEAYAQEFAEEEAALKAREEGESAGAGTTHGIGAARRRRRRRRRCRRGPPRRQRRQRRRQLRRQRRRRGHVDGDPGAFAGSVSAAVARRRASAAAPPGGAQPHSQRGWEGGRTARRLPTRGPA